ncbi:hypothetical protein BP00DRAFT_444312 [Aspergillus indologenus CBS 114.80]|uniref:Uncharacterized protein n=1 Tax=Aspergillus indologenus CBS 114.80 TaxID=1450541 RepID=A0A2V5IXW5_9EURO|nr:hypothetical protein BP00DRAFT_444312 [Aspergillus indologenus CBS 114.80]
MSCAGCGLRLRAAGGQLTALLGRGLRAPAAAARSPQPAPNPQPQPAARSLRLSKAVSLDPQAPHPSSRRAKRGLSRAEVLLSFLLKAKGY